MGFLCASCSTGMIMAPHRALAPTSTVRAAPAQPATVAATEPQSGFSLTYQHGPSGIPSSAVLRLDQRRFRVAWHPGTRVPGGTGWPMLPELTGTERATVYATFNGGFTGPASRGGVLAGRHREGVLRRGAASFVIDTQGRVSILAWPGGDPPAGTAVVRQNLDLLIVEGQPAETVGQDDSSVWGKGLHHRHATWRTAAGITRSGDLVVVIATRATTRELAQLTVEAGAVTAMELDINPQFSCLITYSHSGRVVSPRNVLPQQQGYAGRHLQRSLRDFFSVSPRA